MAFPRETLLLVFKNQYIDFRIVLHRSHQTSDAKTITDMKSMKRFAKVYTAKYNSFCVSRSGYDLYHQPTPHTHQNKHTVRGINTVGNTTKQRFNTEFMFSTTMAWSTAKF